MGGAMGARYHLQHPLNSKAFTQKFWSAATCAVGIRHLNACPCQIHVPLSGYASTGGSPPSDYAPTIGLHPRGSHSPTGRENRCPDTPKVHRQQRGALMLSHTARSMGWQPTFQRWSWDSAPGWECPSQH